MSSQLDIIRSFFKSLCENEDLDLAVSSSSNGIYESYDALINDFNTILKNTSEDKFDNFLKTYCGVDMSNEDTGSPLGIEVSGSTIKKPTDLVDMTAPQITYDEAVNKGWFASKEYPFSNEGSIYVANKECLYYDIGIFRFYWCEEEWPQNNVEIIKKFLMILFNKCLESAIDLNQNVYNKKFDLTNTNLEKDENKILCALRLTDSNDYAGACRAMWDFIDWTSVLFGGNGYGSIAIATDTIKNYIEKNNLFLASTVGHEFNHLLLYSYGILKFDKFPKAITEGLADLVVGSKIRGNFNQLVIENFDLNNLAKSSSYTYSNIQHDGASYEICYQYHYGFLLLRYFMRKCAGEISDITYEDRYKIEELLKKCADLSDAEAYSGNSENEDEFTSYCFNRISAYLQNSSYNETEKAELSEYASQFYSDTYKTYYENTKNNLYYIIYRQYEPSANTSSIQTVYDKYWPIYQQGYSEQSVYSKFWEKYKTLRETTTKNAASTVNAQWNYTEATGKTQDDIVKGVSEQAIRELRPTPGYTNYVVDTRKSLSGLVSSAMLKRYYSNIDAEIYINGEWVEDISTIQWSIDQQTMPIYGYNSYIFDDIAQGSRIITGSFTLAFTEPRRLEEVIKTYLATNENAKKVSYEEVITQLSTKTVELNRNGKKLISNKVHMPLWAGEKFDIDIVCGEYETTGGEAVHIILKDCYLTGTKSVRSKDGGVAEELYTFIGRDFKTIS